MTGVSITYETFPDGSERRSTTCLHPCADCALNVIARTVRGDVVFDNEDETRAGCMMTNPRAIHNTACGNNVSATIPRPSRFARLRNSFKGK